MENQENTSESVSELNATEKIENVIQNIEEKLLNDKNLLFSSENSDEPPLAASARVRDIIQKHLTFEPDNMGEKSISDIIDSDNSESFISTIIDKSSLNLKKLGLENEKLKSKLTLIESKLERTKKERNAATIRAKKIELIYNSEKQNSHYNYSMSSNSDIDDSEKKIDVDYGKSKVFYNQNLNQFSTSEYAMKNIYNEQYTKQINNYKQCLEKQQDQNKHLHNKVIKYKTENYELEKELKLMSQKYEDNNDKLKKKNESESKTKSVESQYGMNLETAIETLSDEKKRNEEIILQNRSLRDELDQTLSLNFDLRLNNEKCEKENNALIDEIETKQKIWNEEEVSFNQYYNAERAKVAEMWKHIIEFREQFETMKKFTSRQLNSLHEDILSAKQNVDSTNNTINASINEKLKIILDKSNEDSSKIKMELREKKREIFDLKTKYDNTLSNVGSREMTETNEKLRSNIANLEKKVFDLKQQVHENDAKSSDRDEADSTSSKCENVEAMHDALRRISNEILIDNEYSLDNHISLNDVKSKINEKEKFNGNVNLNTPRMRHGFADSTYQAVQAALNKRQLQLSELKAKVSSLDEQNTLFKKQIDQLDINSKKHNETLSEMHERNEIVTQNLSEAQEKVESYELLNENLKNHQKNIEKQKSELMEQINNLINQNKIVNNNLSDLKEENNNLENELGMKIEISEKMSKDLKKEQKLSKDFSAEISSLNTEISMLNENINNLNMTQEILQQKKDIVDSNLIKYEERNSILLNKIQKYKNDKAQLRDNITNLKNEKESLLEEKSNLKENVIMNEKDIADLIGQRENLTDEAMHLKGVIGDIEQKLIDNENEKNALSKKLTQSETQRNELQENVHQLTKDKNVLNSSLNQINREKQTMFEELNKNKKELDRLQTAISRIQSEKEIISKQEAALAVQLKALERTNQSVNEENLSLKLHTSGLESRLYQSEEAFSHLESKRQSLEQETQDLSIKKDQLHEEYVKLSKEYEHQKNVYQSELEKEKLSNLRNTEELTNNIKLLQDNHLEYVEKLNQEKTILQDTMEKEKADLINQNENEKDELNVKLKNEAANHSKEVSILKKRNKEDSELHENLRQTELLKFNQEKNQLLEKISTLENDITVMSLENDKICQDKLVFENDARNKISKLQSDASEQKKNLDQTVIKYQDEIRQHEMDFENLVSQKKSIEIDLAENRISLTLSNQKKEGFKNMADEYTSIINNYKNTDELLRQEKEELQLKCCDIERECSSLKNHAADFRSKILNLEKDKTETVQKLNEFIKANEDISNENMNIQQEEKVTKMKFKESEKNRHVIRHELQELKRQIKIIDAEKSNLQQHLCSSRTEICRNDKRDQDNRQQLLNQKEQLIKFDAYNDTLTKQIEMLKEKLVANTEVHSNRERELDTCLEDVRLSLKRLEQEHASLEEAYELISLELNNTLIKLSSMQGRKDALESEVSRLEDSGRDLSNKLSSIYSILRQTLGLQRNMTENYDVDYETYGNGNKNAPRCRSPNPKRFNTASVFDKIKHRSRSAPPHKEDISDGSLENSHTTDTYIQPDVIRHTLQNFVQRVKNSDMERDELNSQLRIVGSDLTEVDQIKKRLEMKSTQLEDAIRTLEEEKNQLNTRLKKAKSASILQEETIHRLVRENKQQDNKICNYERCVISSDNEINRKNEKIIKLKEIECHLLEEKKSLKSLLEESSNNIKNLELNKRNIDCEIQRCQCSLQERENDIYTLKKNIEDIVRTKQDREVDIHSKNLEIKRLHGIVDKCNHEDRENKEKIKALTNSIAETTNIVTELHKKLENYQNDLTNAENDKRVLNDIVDNLNKNNGHIKKEKNDLANNIIDLRENVESLAINNSDMEKQLQTKLKEYHDKCIHLQDSERKIEKLSSETQILHERIMSFDRQLTNYQGDKKNLEKLYKRCDKEKNNLEKQLQKLEKDKFKAGKMLSNSVIRNESTDRIVDQMERKTREYKSKIHSLQKQLRSAKEFNKITSTDATHSHKDIQNEIIGLMERQKEIENSNEYNEQRHKNKIKILEDEISALKHTNREMQMKMRTRTMDDERLNKYRSTTDLKSKDVKSEYQNYYNRIDPTLLKEEQSRLTESIRASTPLNHKFIPKKNPNISLIGNIPYSSKKYRNY